MPELPQKPRPIPPGPPELKAVAYQSRHVKPSKVQSIGTVVSTLLLFLLAPIVAILITTFCFQSYQVDGISMEATLQNNDRLIVNKIPRTVSKVTGHDFIPKRGSVIIFEEFGLYDVSGKEERQLIKRVIGIPGDRVVIKDGGVTVYNDEHPDGYNPDQVGKFTLGTSETSGTIDTTLTDSQVFVLGDNRQNSADSRLFGPINANQIIGQLSFRVLPLSNAKHF